MPADSSTPAFMIRAAHAALDIAEALSVGQPPAQPPGAQPGGPAPISPPPTQGAAPAPQGAQPGGPAMPAQRPGLTALQSMPDFRSPPVAAALQGAAGAQGPVGFAVGGRVDLSVRRGR